MLIHTVLHMTLFCYTLLRLTGALASYCVGWHYEAVQVSFFPMSHLIFSDKTTVTKASILIYELSDRPLIKILHTSSMTERYYILVAWPLDKRNIFFHSNHGTMWVREGLAPQPYFFFSSLLKSTTLRIAFVTAITVTEASVI